MSPTDTSPQGAELRVWLDDDLVDRAAPRGWTHVTTAQDAIDLLNAGKVVELSLDHDLGDDDLYGRGIDVVEMTADRRAPLRYCATFGLGSRELAVRP